MTTTTNEETPAPAAAVEVEPIEPSPPVDSPGRLEQIVESLLFASDKPLGLADLKRLTGERDGKKIGASLDAIRERHHGHGIGLVSVASAWQFRTNPDSAPWVAKLLAGRPARLSRAMLETLAIVAYRQPVTRPEVDEIRGVDCGPVLSTLLERGLIRVIGRKEEVGRPMLYGTTPEFLRTFSLKDLSELPTLREFHELSAAEMARVDAQASAPQEALPDDGSVARGGGDGGVTSALAQPVAMASIDPDEDDALIDEIDRATEAAAKATATGDASVDPSEPSDPSARA